MTSEPQPTFYELSRYEAAAPPFLHGWRNLIGQAAEPNPFYEDWYLLPSLQLLDNDEQIKILALKAGELVIGLLPFCRARRYYGRPIPHMSNWLHPNAFLGSPLIRSGYEELFWQSLLKWCDQNSGLGLFLHLADIPLEGPQFDALRQVATNNRRSFAVVQRTDRAMLKSEESTEAYLTQSLSGKKRKELRRQFTRLSEVGAPEYQRQNDDSDINSWVDEFLQLEAAGWKGQAGSALASHSNTSTLFREVLAGAATAGKLERLTLRLDGKPLAMLATFITPPGAFSYKTAFDESFSRYSPGVQLQCENLALLSQPDIAWTDSCAAADHPMIDHIWRERRPVGKVSIAIGNRAKRVIFSQLLKAETRNVRSRGDE